MKAHINGIDIHYQVSGDGPWVVLSHSLACDLTMWQPQIEVLSGRYRVLAFDTRGHGASSAPPGPYDFGQLTDDVIGLLDHLGIARCHFVGLSMGGMIGQHLALAAPTRLASLVLADTASRYPAEVLPMWQERIRLVGEQGMEAMVEGTLARWFSAPFGTAQPQVVARVAGLIRTTPAAGYIGCCHAIPRLDITARLGAISVPTLVIVGAEDAATPPAMAEAITAAIPDARLAVIPQAAHLANLEQPQAFNRLLLEFLDRQA